MSIRTLPITIVDYFHTYSYVSLIQTKSVHNKCLNNIMLCYMTGCVADDKSGCVCDSEGLYCEKCNDGYGYDPYTGMCQSRFMSTWPL